MEYKNFKKLSGYESIPESKILLLLEERPMRTIEIAKKEKIKQAAALYILKKMEKKDKAVKRRDGKNIYWGLKSKLEEQNL